MYIIYSSIRAEIIKREGLIMNVNISVLTFFYKKKDKKLK